jgi:hypothetical protein
MKSDRIKHGREHEGSFSVGLEERLRHPEAEGKGRFSQGLEEGNLGGSNSSSSRA